MVLKGGTILRVKSSELRLEDFCVLRVCLHDTFISVSRATMLTNKKDKGREGNGRKMAYILQLFENIADLRLLDFG